jgi:hypothetical protein
VTVNPPHLFPFPTHGVLLLCSKNRRHNNTNRREKRGKQLKARRAEVLIGKSRVYYVRVWGLVFRFGFTDLSKY